MKINPYQTLTLSGFDVSVLQKRIAEERARNVKTLVRLNDFTIGVIPDNDYIPAFNHTIRLNSNTDPQTACTLVVDLRPYSRKIMEEPGYAIRNNQVVDMLKMRAGLEFIFTEEPLMLRSMSALPTRVFMRMVSDAVSRRCNLAMSDLVTLNVISAVYYFSCFEDEGTADWSSDEWTRIVQKLSSVTGIGGDVIHRIWDGRIIRDPVMFCDALKEAVGKHSIQILNPALLYGLTASFKFGANMRENLAVALEHPPTWIALVVDGINNRASDPMSNVLKSENRGELGRQLTVMVNRMIAEIN